MEKGKEGIVFKSKKDIEEYLKEKKGELNNDEEKEVLGGKSEEEREEQELKRIIEEEEGRLEESGFGKE